jgi:hypothetical protein
MKALAAKTIVSLREEPSRKSPLDDEVLYGMTVEVLEEVPDASGSGEDWLHIRTEYNYEGYCKKEELILDDAKASEWETAPLRVVMRPYADVLDEPRVQGVCLKSVTRGGRVAFRGFVEDAPGWVKVRLADGREGYTREKYIGPYYAEPFTEKRELFRDRLVETAKSYLGTQYRWGGKTPLGIDCSGLTGMCYLLCGVKIYRNAAIKDGYPVKEIPFEEKKPGDLLYFPGHIAMYMGDDRYIHSTGKNGSDGVVINSLNPEHEDFRQDLLDSLQCVGSIFVD